MNDNDTTVAQLRRLMGRFVAEREWQQFHTPKNLASSIAIEAAELMEHFQWLTPQQAADVRDDPETVSKVAEELADVTAYVLSFAEAMDIDLSAALEAKMKKNERRYPADEFRGRFK